MLRYIAFSHVEADECGSLADFLRVAPGSQPVCSEVAAMVSVSDLVDVEPLGMADGQTLDLGRHKLVWQSTPHLPHGWDAGVMFDETDATLFCSDLFHHFGDVAAVTEGDILGRVREAMRLMQSGPLIGYMPYTCHTDPLLRRLAELKPRTLAVMHGSSYTGDGGKALCDLAGLVREAFDVTG